MSVNQCNIFKHDGALCNSSKFVKICWGRKYAVVGLATTCPRLKSHWRFVDACRKESVRKASSKPKIGLYFYQRITVLVWINEISSKHCISLWTIGSTILERCWKNTQVIQNTKFTAKRLYSFVYVLFLYFYTKTSVFI